MQRLLRRLFQWCSAAAPLAERSLAEKKRLHGSKRNCNSRIASKVMLVCPPHAISILVLRMVQRCMEGHQSHCAHFMADAYAVPAGNKYKLLYDPDRSRKSADDDLSKIRRARLCQLIWIGLPN